MGLFSKMRGKAPANDNLNVARGLLAAPVMMATADGKVEESEVQEIINLCMQNNIFVSLGLNRTTDLVKEVMLDLAKRGQTPVFEDAMGVLAMELRETGICFAVRVAISDGHIDETEFQTLVAMAQKAGLSADRFNQIFEVLMMLHRSKAA